MRKVPLARFGSLLKTELRHGRVTFLIGAGVSMQPPSLLPSGPALRDLIVESICGAPLRREWLALRRHPRYVAKVPEIVFQQIYDCITEKLFPFFDALTAADPNPLHRMLAASGAKLTTTNFDMLLEAVDPSIDVLHLHGELSTPGVMVVRITQVGRGLEAALQREFSAAVRGRTLCVLGYSGNDHDIAAACRIGGPSRVLWLMRDRRDYGWENIERFISPKMDVVAAAGDINELGALLGYPPAPSPSPRAIEQRRRRASKAAASRLTLAERMACLAEISYAIDEYEQAAALARRGLRATRNPNLAAVLRSVAANALKVGGFWDAAIAAVLPIVRLPRGKVAPYEYAVARNALGTVWLEREDYDMKKALPEFRSALAALDRVVITDDVARERVHLLRGKIHNNIGVALEFSGKPDQAAHHYRRSHEEKLRTGDLMGQSQALIGLGLLQYSQRDFARARRTLRKAASIYERYDFPFQKAYVLRRLGTMQAERKRRASALGSLHEALRIYESIPTARFGRELTAKLIAKLG